MTAGNGPSVDIDHVINTIRSWRDIATQLPRAVELESELAQDGLASPKYQIAHSSWAAIMQAIDHLHAMQALITEAKMLHTYAPFALIRAGLENAAMAVWLLGPDDRETRLTRQLHLTYEDINQGTAAYDLLATAPPRSPSAEARKREIIDLAKSLGLDPGAVGGKFGYERIVRRAAEHTNVTPDTAVYTWRLCSGYSHGRQWASLHALNREVKDSDVEGVANVRFTTSVEQVMLLASYVLVFNNEALKLYEQRRLS